MYDDSHNKKEINNLNQDKKYLKDHLHLIVVDRKIIDKIEPLIENRQIKNYNDLKEKIIELQHERKERKTTKPTQYKKENYGKIIKKERENRNKKVEKDEKQIKKLIKYTKTKTNDLIIINKIEQLIKNETLINESMIDLKIKELKGDADEEVNIIPKPKNKYCPKCGHRITSPLDKLCKNCGYNLRDNNKTTHQTKKLETKKETEKTTDSKDNGSLLSCLVAVIIFIILAILGLK